MTDLARILDSLPADDLSALVRQARNRQKVHWKQARAAALQRCMREMPDRDLYRKQAVRKIQHELALYIGSAAGKIHKAGLVPPPPATEYKAAIRAFAEANRFQELGIRQLLDILAGKA